MTFHRSAKLGLSGRFALVQAIEGGMSVRAAAVAFRVSPATAHRWWGRWREAGEEARGTLVCLCDRSSRPHRSPRRLAQELQERICACRRETGWGPRLVAAATGFAHSTVWKVLRRAGISRPPRAVRQAANRYEWPCPGDLLHMDVSRHARFERPGHAVTGDRSQRSRNWMRAERRGDGHRAPRTSPRTRASGRGEGSGRRLRARGWPSRRGGAYGYSVCSR